MCIIDEQDCCQEIKSGVGAMSEERKCHGGALKPSCHHSRKLCIFMCLKGAGHQYWRPGPPQQLRVLCGHQEAGCPLPHP